MPPDLLARARSHVYRLGWDVIGYEREDLVSEFVIAGGLACRKRWCWNLFELAGTRRLMDMMRASRRMKRYAESAPWEYLDDVVCDEDDGFAPAEARLTIAALLRVAGLSALETEAIVHFIDGRREGLWSGRREFGSHDRRHNASYKAIRRLRAAADGSPLPARNRRTP